MRAFLITVLGIGLQFTVCEAAAMVSVVQSTDVASAMTPAGPDSSSCVTSSPDIDSEVSDVKGSSCPGGSVCVQQSATFVLQREALAGSTTTTIDDANMPAPLALEALDTHPQFLARAGPIYEGVLFCSHCLVQRE